MHLPIRWLGSVVCLASLPLLAAELGGDSTLQAPADFATARAAAERAVNKFRLADGFHAELVANEPQLKNPVAFHIGNDGKIYISETGRYRSSTLDIRHYMSWYDDDLASRTVEDRVAMIKRNTGDNWTKLQQETETIRLLEDRDGDGVAEFSTVFADGFTNVLDGIASGVMARDGWVYFTDIPSVWRLRDNDGDGKADEREQLSHGYGVHFSLTGHDLHGLIKGPDGRIYFSVGDRGAHIKTKEGNVIDLPDEGAVFRMEPDGSHLEVFARGLRNPQELAFNQYGDLFTGDNDCDHGDHERWVHVVEGADYGWRIGYQFSEQNPGGVWMSERIWWTNFPGRVAAYLPPLAHTDNGPSGLAYYPGTGLPASFNDTFFLCHFKGQDSVSGIKMIKQVADGASYRVLEQPELMWNVMPTDVDFGPDGHLYLTDWVEGWPKSEKGRIYRLVHEQTDPRSGEVKQVLASGMKQRSATELAKLLEHDDMRVRLEAQWELAERPENGGNDIVKMLAGTVLNSSHRMARLHSIWALTQLARRLNDDQIINPLMDLLPVLSDPDPIIVAALPDMYSEAGLANVREDLNPLLTAKNDRARAKAALALARSSRHYRVAQTVAEKLKDEVLVKMDQARRAVTGSGAVRGTKLSSWSFPFDGLESMLADAASQDSPYLRHAAVQLLASAFRLTTSPGFTRGIEQYPEHQKLFENPNPAIRMGALMALREIEHTYITNFLADPDPLLVVEAARAINDAPLPGAMPALAAMLNQPREDNQKPSKLGAILSRSREPSKTQTVSVDSSGVAEALAAEDYPDLVARPLLRRVLNANFRVGQADNAVALAEFAAQLPGNDERSSLMEAAREEALLMLSQWASPSPRDKVMGLYRPLDDRAARPAADALADRLEQLLGKESSDAVKTAALDAAAKLRIGSAAPLITELFSDPEIDGRVRAASLKALASMNAPQLPAALKSASTDFDSTVRKAAMLLASNSASGAAAPQLAEVLQSGSIDEQQAALTALAQIPGTVADEIIYGVLRPWVEGGPLDPALELEVLEASRARGDERIKAYLARHEAGLPAGSKTAPYHWALSGGDPAAGKRVFIEHPAAACYRCHAVEGAGGNVGPAMDGIAGRLAPEELLRAIVDPNAAIAAGFENQLVQLKNGAFYSGIVAEETETEITLNSPEDGLLNLKKSEIQSRERGASGMPEGLEQILTRQELRDVIAFLTGLKKPGGS